ncbi:hypothetical protein GYA49_03855 [Candidatus Beckwithbacteria bacterium]|nr:hypothetical protein [Candidatus Beckwithbacteria bacterium]
MKLPFYLVLASTTLFAACSLQNIPNPISSPSPSASPKTQQSSNPTPANFENIKKQVDTALESYSNPKRATLRRDDWTRAGKVYMQYDKTLDKTLFWVELTDFAKPQAGSLTVYLLDTKQKEEKDQKLNVGTISFDKDGQGLLYFEFPGKGNFYSYLKVVVERNKEKVLEANFSPKLS